MKVETSDLAPKQIWHTTLKQILYSLVKTVLCCFMKRCLPKVIAHVDETFTFPFLHQVPKKNSMQCYTKNAALLYYLQSEFQNMVLNSLVFTQKPCMITCLLLHTNIFCIQFYMTYPIEFLYFMPQFFFFFFLFSHRTDIWVLFKNTSLPVSAKVPAHAHA